MNFLPVSDIERNENEIGQSVLKLATEDRKKAKKRNEHSHLNGETQQQCSLKPRSMDDEIELCLLSSGQMECENSMRKSRKRHIERMIIIGNGYHNRI